MFTTADICDEHDVQVADPIFRDFGGSSSFCGPVSTLKVFEDNQLVRSALEEPGKGRVLVVDGGGSLRCALVGDRLAALAKNNGWAGIIVYGCIRDARPIRDIEVGVKALAAHPKKSVKRGEGVRDLAVTFAGVTFAPGSYVYADEDGLVVHHGPVATALV
jgi:regulator of ribonuclease activity A